MEIPGLPWESNTMPWLRKCTETEQMSGTGAGESGRCFRKAPHVYLSLGQSHAAGRHLRGTGAPYPFCLPSLGRTPATQQETGLSPLCGYDWPCDSARVLRRGGKVMWQLLGHTLGSGGMSVPFPSPHTRARAYKPGESHTWGQCPTEGGWLSAPWTTVLTWPTPAVLKPLGISVLHHMQRNS